MINRILIRIKVVQILYSYLLSRSEFKINVAPDGSSRDRRFAYAVYLDMLILIQELSGYRINNPDRGVFALDVDKYIRTNRVGKALSDNHVLKEITFKNASDFALLKPIIAKLRDSILDSTIYKDYTRKRSRTLEDDVKFWTVVLETIVLKSPEVTQVLRANPGFSLTGLHHGIMDAVDTLRSYSDTRYAYQKAKNELEESLNEAYELYLAMFVLITELTDEQNDRLEAAKAKYLATAEDLNPDTKLVDNLFVAYLRDNEVLKEFVDKSKFTWVSSPGLLKSLLDSILASDLYRNYIAEPEHTWTGDCEFWRDVMRNIIIPSDSIDEALEVMSIFWNDDLSTVGTFILKTIRKFSASSAQGLDVDFLPQYKDDEDAAFGGKLFTLTVENRELYRSYIEQFISNDWDPERLAFMDIVIMMVAIAEIVNFPAIPIPVSLNEYIEIANMYSTRRSGPFINGILYSVVKKLSDEGRLSKPFGVATDSETQTKE